MSQQLERARSEMDMFIENLEGEITWHKAEIRFSEGEEKTALQQYKQALEYSLSYVKKIRKVLDEPT